MCVMNIHPAPTTNVLPGSRSKLKISSLVMPYSTAPGMFEYLGRPPTAITTFLAVIDFSVLFFITAPIVCASLKYPSPLMYSTFLE